MRYELLELTLRRAVGRLSLPLSGSNSVVECNLAKVDVAGSNPVSRSSPPSRPPLSSLGSAPNARIAWARRLRMRTGDDLGRPETAEIDENRPSRVRLTRDIRIEEDRTDARARVICENRRR